MVFSHQFTSVLINIITNGEDDFRPSFIIFSNRVFYYKKWKKKPTSLANKFVYNPTYRTPHSFLLDYPMVLNVVVNLLGILKVTCLKKMLTIIIHNI